MPTDHQPTHQITVGGRYNFDGQVIDCPQCGTERGLAFMAFADDRVRGGCPSGHAWDEERLPAQAVRYAAEACTA